MPHPALPPEPPALVSSAESTEQRQPSVNAVHSTVQTQWPSTSISTAEKLMPLQAVPSSVLRLSFPASTPSIDMLDISQQPSSGPTLLLETESEPEAPNSLERVPEESPDNQPSSSAPSSPDTAAPASQTRVLEVTGDRQDFDTFQKVLFAVGNVFLRFQEAELSADRIKTTLNDRQVVAEGQVKLTRGDQILQGERLEYDLEQNRGTFFKTSGTISFPSSDRDFSLDTPNTNLTGGTPLDPLSGPRRTDLNPNRVKAKSGTETIRFTADRIDFADGNWTATNIRITNDPFSPPELEVRASTATLTRVSATEDRLKLKRPRLVFDQKISIPFLQPSLRVGRGRRDPLRIRVGFDDRDRGGLFVGSPFNLVTGDKFNFTITPQIFLSRLVGRDFNVVDPDVYGFTTSFGGRLSPTTNVDVFAFFNTLDLTNAADNIRARFRLRQQIGDHQLSAESAYRERSLSGSLGEQEVLSRNGLILTSPTYRLGKSGLDLNYRVSAEYIFALTDRPDLDSPTGLGRFQGSFSLGRTFTLWQGKTLAPTATEGLRYTPTPIRPNLKLIAGLGNTTSAYTNGDTQATLVASVRLEGQFGHFSRSYLDYTSFNLGYAQVLRSGTSPFAFDRVVDEMVLSGGILQHLYGPFRLGFQTSVNLDTGELFNTDIILDYSRRTYGVTLRYNPELEAVSLLFRVGGFNWVGNRGPLSSPEVGAVETGVQETNDSF